MGLKPGQSVLSGHCEYCGHSLVAGYRWLTGRRRCLNVLNCADRLRRDMRKNWQTFVYQTDVTPQKFRGAFYDADEAQKWADKQKEGTYEVSTEKPSDRKERLGEGQEAPSA